MVFEVIQMVNWDLMVETENMIHFIGLKTREIAKFILPIIYQISSIKIYMQTIMVLIDNSREKEREMPVYGCGLQVN